MGQQLNVDNVKFPAHKFMLSARSPVFAAMFQHDTKENQEDAVDIPHIQSDAFKVALKFIYTGDVKGVEKYADELLGFANQYDLDQLKSRCEDVMAAELSLVNAFHHLVSAELNCAKRLKKMAISYLIKDEILSTADWKDFATSHPLLLLELYQEKKTIKPK